MVELITNLSIINDFSPEIITFLKGIFDDGINFTIRMLITKQFILFDIIFSWNNFRNNLSWFKYSSFC